MNKAIKTFIKVNDWGEMQLDLLVDTVKTLKDYGTWNLEKWRPTPALIDKNSKISRQYVGQSYDPKYIDLVSEGWTHDHCEICSRTISDNDSGDRDVLRTRPRIIQLPICASPSGQIEQ